MQKKCRRHDDVGDEELGAFEPVGFAVLDDQIHDDDGKQNAHQLERVEDQRHLVLE